jgi:protein TonB
MAGCLTVGLFLALPYVHVVEPPSGPELELIPVEHANVRVPPPLPLPERVIEEPESEMLPKPELSTPRPEAVPLTAMLEFDFGPPAIGGDFDLAFSVDAIANVADASASVFELSDVDQTPQPMIQLQPLYPAHARMRQIEGEVTVEFIVTPKGHTDGIVVLSSEPGEMFRRAAIRAVERWRFRPAQRGGVPVAVRVRQRIRFQLEE